MKTALCCFAHRVDETCDGRGICAQVCPVGNIRMEGERPRWRPR